MPGSKIDPDGLQYYFTDAEVIRGKFKDTALSSSLIKRLFIIHGVGGIGKTSLLRMFRLYCKRAHIPVALASGEDDKSPIQILSRWQKDLNQDQIVMTGFSKLLEKYLAIQAKVSDELRKVEKRKGKVVQSIGKAAAKTALEIVTGYIPVFGPIINAVGSSSTEAFVDWLGGFLVKPEIGLLLDPVQKLTDEFLKDIEKGSHKSRLVLMLDTYETLAGLDDWICTFAHRLDTNVLFVIAGRELMNWERQWPNWISEADINLLEPMQSDDIRKLIRRYYSTQVGGDPDPDQVEKIIRFARGLPVAVTTAVRLWVKYQVKTLEEVEAGAVGELVWRLRSGVPSEAIPALDAVSVLRYFNKEILRALIGNSQLDIIYEELRKFPFVKSGLEGKMAILRLHDTVREFTDRMLEIDDPVRHRELHFLAAGYFQNKMEQAGDEDLETLRLEHLFHLLNADENKGMVYFQRLAEEFAQYRLNNRLRTLINDVKTYYLGKSKDNAWINYYQARLALIEMRFEEAEKLLQELNLVSLSNPKLKAYALTDWGEILSMTDNLVKPNVLPNAVQVLGQSLQQNWIDFHVSQSYFNLARVAGYLGKWGDDKLYLDQAKDFFENINDYYGVAYTYSEIKRSSGRRGVWGEFFEAHEKGLEAMKKLPAQPKELQAVFLGKWVIVFALAGRYSECETYVKQALEFQSERHENQLTVRSYRHLGWTLGFQRRFTECDDAFQKSVDVNLKLGREQLQIDWAATISQWGITIIRSGDLERAECLIRSSLEMKEKINYENSMIENMIGLAWISEIRKDWISAEGYYRRGMEYKSIKQYYYDCLVYLGMARVQLRLGNLESFCEHKQKGLEIAQCYEYNDIMSFLYLLDGTAAWEENRIGIESVINSYRSALVYALRYNRFILDEVLWGDNVITPLTPIVNDCMAHGQKGQQVLKSLSEWWQVGINDPGQTRPDTISLINEGIPLLQGERLVRQRERGDGIPQKTVVERIQGALMH